MTTTYNFREQMSGSDITLRFPVKVGGVSIDLEGSTIEFGLSATASASGETVITKTLADDDITLVDYRGTNDAFEVTLTAAETEALSGRRYYECRIVDADGRVGFSHKGVIPFAANMLEG
jgi:hypothetical protein